jgi:spore maturation protein CgeB
MKLMYAALKYDYNQRERGFSFEHYNFFNCLQRMGCDVLYFDYGTLLKNYGRSRMNQRLWDVVRAEKPELLFTFLTNEELDKHIVQRISAGGQTITLNWFADDHYRFDGYSRHWAPCFNWVVTTAHSALPKYRAAGIRNVIPSQWACNTFLYQKLDLPKKYDATFVGAAHGNRPELLHYLRNAGIDVQWWGFGSDNGRISQQRMIEVFNESRINLNFAGATVRTPVRQNNRRRVRALFPHSLVPIGSRVIRPLRTAARRCVFSYQVSRASSVWGIPQIKGRSFEIPGCGSFMLTGRAENFNDYFDEGKEVGMFNDVDELVTKLKYYLKHEEEREWIAHAGYQRCTREHTYVHRFIEIFQRIGVPVRIEAAGDNCSLGAVEEVP